MIVITRFLHKTKNFPKLVNLEWEFFQLNIYCLYNGGANKSDKLG